MTDKDIIEYHEIQEERMAREICRLRIIIDNLKAENKKLKAKTENLYELEMGKLNKELE